MGRTTLLAISATVCCALLARAESPVTSYSIGGDATNGYDYSNSVPNGGYVGGKDNRKETGNFYTGMTNGHSLVGNGNQVSVEGGLGSSSYNGFSPSSQNSAFRGYSGGTHDNVAGSSYNLNSHASSSFAGYANGNGNGDATLEGYATGVPQSGSSFSQYPSSGYKNSYVGQSSEAGYSDSISGASPSTSYTNESPIFRGYSTSSPRDPGFTGFLEGHGMNSESYFYNNPPADHAFSKFKDGMFGVASGVKHTNDIHSSPSDMRYVRGHIGRESSAQTPIYLSTSGATNPLSIMRGSSPSVYSYPKMTKYGNKYLGDYAVNAGGSYVAKDQDGDYLSGSSNYGKGSGKVIIIKDTRPSSYAGHSYPSGISYLSKLAGSGSYKSKPSSFVSYPGASVAYSAMPNSHSSFGNSNYGDGHVTRGYRSSSGAYAPAHASMYPVYS